MLLGVFESVDDAYCDDRILNSLVCFLFEIFCEEGVGLGGRSDAQQSLEGLKPLGFVQKNDDKV